jgi:hypothetical protein
MKTMKNLAEYLSEESHNRRVYNSIDEADKIIDETYQYMGIKKQFTTKTMIASNIVIKNGRTRTKKVSNGK